MFRPAVPFKRHPLWLVALLFLVACQQSATPPVSSPNVLPEAALVFPSSILILYNDSTPVSLRANLESWSVASTALAALSQGNFSPILSKILLAP
jgi:hypothetical protein